MGLIADIKMIKEGLMQMDKSMREDSICPNCGKPKQGFISTVSGEYKSGSPSHLLSVKKSIESLCDCDGKLSEALTKFHTQPQ